MEKAIVDYLLPFLDKLYNSRVWDIGVSLSALLVVYFAYRAVKQTSKQLEIEQTPYVVLSDRITTAGDDRLHTISLKNIGRGSAVNITATTDPQGKISIIEGSNPHSINLASKDYHNGWAIDEGQLIKGLKNQGKIIKKSIIQELPDENSIDKEEEKYKSEFFIYIWYNDQYGHRYETEAKIRRSGLFFKVMENKFKRLS